MLQIGRRRFLKQAGTVGLALGTASVTGMQSLRAAEGPSRPNILLFFPDQHRYDWLGATRGLGLRTPNLDALGARGVRFIKAVCPAPVCAPSRACLAAGKEYPKEMDSRSMLPLLQGQTDTHRQVVRSALGRWRLAWDGRYKLISGFHSQARGGVRATGENPPDILFDLQEDPVENINIAQKAPGIVRRLRAKL